MFIVPGVVVACAPPPRRWRTTILKAGHRENAQYLSSACTDNRFWAPFVAIQQLFVPIPATLASCQTVFQKGTQIRKRRDYCHQQEFNDTGFCSVGNMAWTQFSMEMT